MGFRIRTVDQLYTLPLTIRTEFTYNFWIHALWQVVMEDQTLADVVAGIFTGVTTALQKVKDGLNAAWDGVVDAGQFIMNDVLQSIISSVAGVADKLIDTVGLTLASIMGSVDYIPDSNSILYNGKLSNSLKIIPNEFALSISTLKSSLEIGGFFETLGLSKGDFKNAERLFISGTSLSLFLQGLAVLKMTQSATIWTQVSLLASSLIFMILAVYLFQPNVYDYYHNTMGNTDVSEDDAFGYTLQILGRTLMWSGFIFFLTWMSKKIAAIFSKDSAIVINLQTGGVFFEWGASGMATSFSWLNIFVNIAIGSVILFAKMAFTFLMSLFGYDSSIQITSTDFLLNAGAVLVPMISLRAALSQEANIPWFKTWASIVAFLWIEIGAVLALFGSAMNDEIEVSAK